MSEEPIRIPEKGIGAETLLAEMKRIAGQDVDWEGAKVWSLVFHQSDPHTEFLKRAHNQFFDCNALNPGAFRSLQQFEREVVRMTADLLNGGDEVVGTMSSGGTESIMLAVKTYRDHARTVKPHIRTPELVLPESAHVAFIKACKYFDVKPVIIPLAADFRVDLDKATAAIGPNTIALVGSAPQYPHGTIDPIEALGELALKHGVGLHVDCCIGGFFLPMIERLGFDVPKFDFRVPGVTSISADVHKYGYAAKGASTILYRSMDYLKHQFFVYVDWPGGVFASPSMPGTRPGGAIAAAWGALRHMGMEGYLDNASRVMGVVRKLQDGINAIEGLEVIGKPAMSVFAYRSKDEKVLNVYAIADFMEERGWYIDRQQRPACLHLMVNPEHEKVADAYLADLREAVAWVKAHPDAAMKGKAATYGLIAGLPARDMVAGKVLERMEQMFSAKGAPASL